ncbi:hypothetical protein BDN67DRAFT_965561 [Paxillus ammoniavirescens]|nr:hypothetical protein BDN67DRAFT_965561 [Paxillus ammoniavirescens]
MWWIGEVSGSVGVGWMWCVWPRYVLRDVQPTRVVHSAISMAVVHAVLVPCLDLDFFRLRLLNPSASWLVPSSRLLRLDWFNP